MLIFTLSRRCCWASQLPPSNTGPVFQPITEYPKIFVRGGIEGLPAWWSRLISRWLSLLHQGGTVSLDFSDGLQDVVHVPSGPKEDILGHRHGGLTHLFVAL
jgi:hypothetical protein